MVKGQTGWAGQATGAVTPVPVASRGPPPEAKTPGIVKIPLFELEIVGFLLLAAVLILVGVTLWSHHHNRAKTKE